MHACKFFLDTSALNYLAGLKGSELESFKNRIEASNAELSTTHIQVDEMTKHIKFNEPAIEMDEKEVQTYQQKIDKALKSLRGKGINVCLENTKMAVAGALRVGYAVFSSKEIGKLYDELREEINMCEKAKGKTKRLLNIVCDAVIAVSSLAHDFFITTDRCLFGSWCKTIDKHKTLKQQFKIPEIIYAKRSPEDVANRILARICTLEE